MCPNDTASPRTVKLGPLKRIPPQLLPDLDQFSRQPRPGHDFDDAGLAKLDVFESEIDTLTDLLIDAVASAFQEIQDRDGMLPGVLPAWMSHTYPFITKPIILEAMRRCGFPLTALNRETGEDISASEAIDMSSAEFAEMVRQFNVDQLKRMPYREYLQTDHWQEVRTRALEASGHRCQLCNADSTIHIHHRTYERRGEEDPADVIALCADCHARFHNKMRVR